MFLKVARKPAFLLAVLLILMISHSMTRAQSSAEARSTPLNFSCKSADFRFGPIWIGSAAWLDPLHVLIVDTLNSDLLRYSLNGNKIEKLGDPRPKDQRQSEFYPAMVVPTGKGFLLNLLDSEFVELNRDLKPVDRGQIFMKSAGQASGVTSLYDWTAAGNRIIAYGAAADDSPEKFTMGFLVAPLDDPLNVKVVKPFDRFEFYTLGHPYLASIGAQAYFLVMDEEPAIYWLPASSQTPVRLPVFPQEPLKIERLRTPNKGPRSTEAIFREVESRPLPVGLYSDDKFLYVLLRRPEVRNDGTRTTSWWVYQIDPSPRNVAAAKISKPLRLPTSEAAHHLTFLPGREAEPFFLVFEKGAVESLGSQSVRRILRLPSSWLTNPANSPLQRVTSQANLCPE